MTYKEAYFTILQNIINADKSIVHEGWEGCWGVLFGNYNLKCISNCDKCFYDNKILFEKQIKNK